MILLWLLVLLFFLTSGYWVAAIAVVTWFAYWYPAWWLLLVMVLLEGYYGNTGELPMLSFSTAAFVIFVEILKMRLLGVAYE